MSEEGDVHDSDLRNGDAHNGDAHDGDAHDAESVGALAASLGASAAQMLPEAAVPGALHVVSTPIGHLGDISLRALAVLHEVAVVCCEDTRTSRTLLARYGIRTAMLALHEHNEAQATPRLLERLRKGDAIALISDAGTPLVSDPGARLVDAAVAAGIRVVPIPGASATLAALVASGIAPHPCTLLGFLPRKGGERTDAIRMAASLPHAVVLFEAPSRVAATLRDLAESAGGDRPAAVARELTKKFEEIRRGTLDELAAYYDDRGARGEIALVMGGAQRVIPTEADLAAVAVSLRDAGQSARDIVAHLMREHGASRNVAYRLAHDR